MIWLIWAVVGVPFGVWCGYCIYAGFPDEEEGPRKPSEIKKGNKRSATLCGILAAISWPLMAALVVLALVVDWVKAGAPS